MEEAPGENHTPLSPQELLSNAGTCSLEHPVKKEQKSGDQRTDLRQVDESYRKVKSHTGHILWPPCNRIKK